MDFDSFDFLRVKASHRVAQIQYVFSLVLGNRQVGDISGCIASNRWSSPTDQEILWWPRGHFLGHSEEKKVLPFAIATS